MAEEATTEATSPSSPTPNSNSNELELSAELSKDELDMFELDSSNSSSLLPLPLPDKTTASASAPVPVPVVALPDIDDSSDSDCDSHSSSSSLPGNDVTALPDIDDSDSDSSSSDDNSNNNNHDDDDEQNETGGNDRGDGEINMNGNANINTNASTIADATSASGEDEDETSISSKFENVNNDDQEEITQEVQVTKDDNNGIDIDNANNNDSSNVNANSNSNDAASIDNKEPQPQDKLESSGTNGSNNGDEVGNDDDDDGNRNGNASQNDTHTIAKDQESAQSPTAAAVTVMDDASIEQAPSDDDEKNVSISREDILPSSLEEAIITNASTSTSASMPEDEAVAIQDATPTSNTVQKEEKVKDQDDDIAKDASSEPFDEMQKQQQQEEGKDTTQDSNPNVASGDEGNGIDNESTKKEHIMETSQPQPQDAKPQDVQVVVVDEDDNNNGNEIANSSTKNNDGTDDANPASEPTRKDKTSSMTDTDETKEEIQPEVDVEDEEKKDIAGNGEDRPKEEISIADSNDDDDTKAEKADVTINQQNGSKLEERGVIVGEVPSATTAVTTGATRALSSHSLLDNDDDSDDENNNGNEDKDSRSVIDGIIVSDVNRNNSIRPHEVIVTEEKKLDAPVSVEETTNSSASVPSSFTATSSARTSSKDKDDAFASASKTPLRKNKNNFRNPFAGWKEKADQVTQVIQSSDVLKAAQRNLEEKKNQIEKAVENVQIRIPGVNVGGDIGGTSVASRGASTGKGSKKSTPIPIDDADDVENDIIQITDADSSDEEDLSIGDNDEGTRGGGGGGGEDDLDDLSYDDDELSKSLRSDDSQGSSVYIDSDDSSCYSNSDGSSIMVRDTSNRQDSPDSSIRSRRGRAGTRQTSRGSPRSRRASTGTGTGQDSPQSRRKENKDRGISRGLKVKVDIRNRSNNIATTPRIANIKRDDNVTSSYNRGRYTQKINANKRNLILEQLQRKVRPPSPPPMTQNRQRRNKKLETQNALIHKAYPIHIIKDRLSKLTPGQYLMYLGNGMLGVNLKQSYLAGLGVYVDMILPGGNAQKSGVIFVGDGLAKVGDSDVSKGTIFDVPSVISTSKRPCLLVLNGEHHIKWEDMDYISVAIGILIKTLKDVKAESLSAPPSENTKEVESKPHTNKSNPVVVSSISMQPSSKELRQALAPFALQRSNQVLSLSTISAACQNDPQLRQALRESFRICCADSRRLPFLAAFLKSGDTVVQDFEEPEKNARATASTRLMLYLELLSYKDLYAVAANEKRYNHAKKIISKFLFPISIELEGDSKNKSNAPVFDVSSLFSPQLLQPLRDIMDSVENNVISRDAFKCIETGLEDSLIGAMASFLLDDECARMRAYMRKTAPFIDPPLDKILCASPTQKPEQVQIANNHMEYIVLYLLCQMEKDVINKNFGTNDKGRVEQTRLVGSAGGMTCAVFIHKMLLPTIDGAKKLLSEKDSDGPKSAELISMLEKCIIIFESFWESFVAPSGGVLDVASCTNETNDVIERVRKCMAHAAKPPADTDRGDRINYIVRSLVLNEDFVRDLGDLRNKLIYSYTTNDHPKFRSHVMHEWMCIEANEALYSVTKDESKTETDDLDLLPNLAKGCISRLIRKLTIPVGISRHSPVHISKNTSIKKRLAETSKCNFNADFAVVFSSMGRNNTDNDEDWVEKDTQYEQSSLHRIACVALSQQVKNKKGDISLPATLESYALVPTFRSRPFKESVYHSRNSRDGFEVSLINFMAPNANNTDGSETGAFLYGVSLVLNYPVDQTRQTEPVKKTIAITLVSERCVIPAMRKTLARLYDEKVTRSKPNSRSCASLVETLEKLKTADCDQTMLSTILEPYLKDGSSDWVDRPLVDQEESFEKSCVEVLVETLSPIPIALLFITALLEQKIVFTSSRRSVLVSMVAGLRSLLRPLGWSHLIVPLAPPALAQDLVQYPAPFIIGVALDNKGSMDLLKTLPMDITLVDVDVGRVILTQEFSHHFESTGVKDLEATTSALRSQVLKLAESIGNLIGVHQSDSIWRCDSPMTESITGVSSDMKVEAVQIIAKAFIRELCAGLNTCCYWIEEDIIDDSSVERDVFFDEDRFLNLKKLRSEGSYLPLFEDRDLAQAHVDETSCELDARPLLALNPKEFGLVLQTFLRGQSFSSYISSQKKESMAYW